MTSLKVLWIDDEIGTVLLEALERKIRKRFDLMTTTSLDEAIEIVKKDNFGAILLDVIFKVPAITYPLSIHPAEYQGSAFFESLREGRFGEYGREVPVVILTATTYKEDIEKIYDFPQKYKNVTVLKKPIDNDLIVSALKKFCE